MEDFFFVASVFFFYALIGKSNGDTFIQISQFAHTCLQNVIFIFGCYKNARIGPESLSCTGDVGSSYFFHCVQRLTIFVFLLIDFSVAEYVCSHVAWKRVNTRYTHTVQTAWNLIRSFVEFTTGVKYGHNHFECRFLFFLMEIYRDTSTVILYGDWIIFVNSNFYVWTVTGQCLVYRVVYNFVYQMVQTFFADVTDIHGGTFTYGFQSF